MKRPSLRAGTKAKIRANAPINAEGAYLDQSFNVIKEPHFGHIYGHENRRILAAAEELGLNQNQLNNYVNARPEFFQIEEKARNLSHANEMIGRENFSGIIADMMKFFGL